MKERVRVVVVDDEPIAREGVVRLLARDRDVDVVGECGDGRTAVELVARLEPDIVFLDVQMPEMNGFEVLRALGRRRTCAVVFVTAFDQYAIRAFEVHAIDYLLKPFDDERFTRALEHAKADVRKLRVDDLQDRLADLLDSVADRPAEGIRSRIVVKSQGRVQFVRAEDIDWIEAADYYAKLHVGGKVHLLRETMGKLETALDPKIFFRVHRSAIVNLDRVREMQPYFRGEDVLILRDGTKLRLSRNRRARLEALLGQAL